MRLCGPGVFVGDAEAELLDFRGARGADAQLLSLIQVNVFATLAQDACGAYAGADGRAHGGATATSENGANHGAYAGADADLLDVIRGRVFSLHSTFGIDFADAIASCLQYLDH